MSLTTGHQIAFRALAMAARDQGDQCRSEAAHETMHALARALDKAVDDMVARDTVLSDRLDHGAGSFQFNPRGKSK